MSQPVRGIVGILALRHHGDLVFVHVSCGPGGLEDGAGVGWDMGRIDAL